MVMAALSGFSLGSIHVAHSRRVAELGDRHYLSALHQWVQLTNVIVIITRLADHAMKHKLSFPLKIARNLLPIATIPLCLMLAAYKSGNYPQFAERWNNYMPVKLPATLSERVERIFAYFAEQGGDLMKVVIYVGLLALHVFGDTTFAKAAFAAIAYDALNQNKHISHEVSAFVEKYMPLLNIVTGNYSDLIVNCITNAVILPTSLLARTNEFVQAMIERFINSHLSISGFSIEEINAPMSDRKQMSYEQIMQILNTPLGTPEAFFAQYEIDPSHCTKWTVDLSQLPRGNNFDEILAFWNSYNDEEKIAAALAHIQRDQQFSREFLEICLPEVNLDTLDPISSSSSAGPDYAQKIRHILEQNSDRSMLIKRDALVWASGNLSSIIRVLKGEGSTSWSHADVTAIRDNVSYLIPHYRTFDRARRLRALLRLSLPASDLTGLSVREASQRLFHDYLIRTTAVEGPEVSMSAANINYEEWLKRELLEHRLKLIKEFATERAQASPSQVGHNLIRATHNLYRSLSRGLLPLNPAESREMGIEELLEGGVRDQDRIELQRRYLCTMGTTIFQEANGQVISHEGVFSNIFFGLRPGLEQLISQNQQLTPAQKIEIMQRFDQLFGNQIDHLLKQQNFQRLVFVMLGVIRVRSGVQGPISHHV